MDANETPMLPNIDAYACRDCLLRYSLFNFLGTNITEPGYIVRLESL